MTEPRGARPLEADSHTNRLALAVRDACIRAALDGYEQAGLSGLCAEGRSEMAVDSMRSLDIDCLTHELSREGAGDDG